MARLDSLKPIEIVHQDGIDWWYGSGRLTVRDSNHTTQMVSRVLRGYPPETDVEPIIAEMVRRMRQQFPSSNGDRNGNGR